MDITSYMLGKKAGGSGPAPTYQSKSVTITENGSTSVSADTGYDALSGVSITTNVQPDLESKSVTISTNTTTTITPSQDKDGLSSVEVTTNVPSQKFSFVGDGSICFYQDTRSNLQDEIDNIAENIDTSSIKNLKYFISSCYNVTSIDLSNLDFSSVTSITNSVYYANGATYIDASCFSNLTVDKVSGFLSGMKSAQTLILPENLTITSSASAMLAYITPSLTQQEISKIFTWHVSGYSNWNNFLVPQEGEYPTRNTNITELDLKNWSGTVTGVVGALRGLNALQKLDVRNFVFSGITNSNNYNQFLGYNMTAYQENVPFNCLIIVKDATEKQWFNSKLSSYTNVKTVAEYEASL